MPAAASLRAHPLVRGRGKHRPYGKPVSPQVDVVRGRPPLRTYAACFVLAGSHSAETAAKSSVLRLACGESARRSTAPTCNRFSPRVDVIHGPGDGMRTGVGNG